MKEEHKELQEDVLDEENAIEETLEILSKVRIKFNPEANNYLIEPAMGTYLMNFYNGIENILKRITREYYLAMPKGANWHKKLLNLSSSPPPGKIAVFNINIVERLYPYRNFRHRFVSGYGFQLKGEKMLELIDDAKPLWIDTKKAISIFWDKL